MDEAINARASLGGRGSRYCVLYLVGRKERRSAWFWNAERAEQARRLMAVKHGRAIVYVD